MIKKRVKEIIVLAVILTIVVMIAVYGIDIQSVEDYYNNPLDKITDDTPVIYLSIDSSTIYDNYDQLESALKDLYPADGEDKILVKTAFALKEGDTVFDVLVRATKHFKIHFEFSHSAVYDSKYIEGIHHLYEFDCGALSGWMFLVNGIFPQSGVNHYNLKDGDNIEIKYTCDLGRDIGGILV